MSWDVLLMNAPPTLTTVHDFPDGFYSELGSRAEVLAILKSAVPGINLADPTWGTLEGRTFSIEFNIGRDNPIQALMLHVRGSDEAIKIIQRICEVSGWRALDTTLGAFIDFGHNPADGLRKWRKFRDSVIPSEENV